MIDKAVPQGANGHLDQAQEDWLRLMPDGWDGTPPETATDVLCAIDQLRRDLSGYHGQLKAQEFYELQKRTCNNTWDTELTGRLRFKCSECGAVSLEITPNYCPNCGAKVVA